MYVSGGVVRESPRRLNSALESSLMREGFAFMQVIVVCACDIDLGNNIF